MQNIRKLINIIQKTNTPLTLRKYDYDTKLQITLSAPYDVLGLNAKDWDILRTRALEYWKEDDNVLTDNLNDIFKSVIAVRYINVLHSLLPQDVVPTIIISILCQSLTDVNTTCFSNNNDFSRDISDYLEALRDVVMIPPTSYSAISTYIIDLYIEPYLHNIENGVSEIYWNAIGQNPTIKDEIFGLLHIWDHYTYPHLHVVDTFELHKYLLLNGIKRTWIAELEITAGIKRPFTRVNYGYMSPKIIPNYTQQEYIYLGKLNYGTVISPPYDIVRIRNMTLKEVEQIVLDTLKCLRKQPTINTIYITPKQLNQERTLGNKPILTRYTVVLPITYNEKMNLYNTYSTNKLPIGLAFDVNNLITRTEVNQSLVVPQIQPNQQQASYRSNGLGVDNLPTAKTLIPREYKTYLGVLSLYTRSQYKISNIKKYMAPTEFEIVTDDIAERIISYMVLNDSEGVLLNNENNYPTSILTPTTQTYALDYMTSVQMLRDFLSYQRFLKNNPKSMNVVIVNASSIPTTYLKLMYFNFVNVQQYSLNGKNGPQIDSLFSFSLMNSNMVYLVITEDDYLNDTNGYHLFTTDLHSGVLYTLEFLDFSSFNLKTALNSLIEGIQLITGKTSVKAQIYPLTLSPYAVGIKIVFSLDDIPYINDDFQLLTDNAIEPFTRAILPTSIAVDPVRSLEYGSKIIPRVGTYLTVRCQDTQFEDALGYVSSICRYVKVKSYATVYTYYGIEGVVDQSRIACIDRLKMFRKCNSIKSTQLLPQEVTLNDVHSLSLSYFELVTQTDRIQLYLYRKSNDMITNDLSDYGSGDYLNLILTDNEYTMYDVDTISTADIPGVYAIQGLLEWNTELPYQGKGDVLIYNSLFLNARAVDDDLSVPILTMLKGVMNANNIYFNVPYMTNQLYQTLEPLKIVEQRNERYFLKLGNYPAVPCLNNTELQNIAKSFPSPQWKMRSLVPTLLDYYFTSRMIQRQAASYDYFNAVALHAALPLFILEKS